jgi:hypothetical protein
MWSLTILSASNPLDTSSSLNAIGTSALLFMQEQRTIHPFVSFSKSKRSFFNLLNFFL